MVRTCGTTAEHSRRVLKKARLLTRPTLARQDAPCPSEAAASNQRWFFQACLCMLSCGGSNESPAARWVRPFQFSPPLFRGVAEGALYCAHRTSTVSSCAFCEQEGHLAAPSPAGGLFQYPAKCLGSRSSETRQLTSKPLPSRRRDSSPRVVHYKTHGGHWGRS